jgi:heme oxygenase
MVAADTPADLASVLRSETQPLHRRAERSGIIADLLRGRASRRGYAIFLRNLHPAYQRMETGLEALRDHPALGPLARREVYRAAALAADLTNLCGADWSERLPLTKAGRDYADHVEAATEGSGERLIGHLYVRYFGDLNGGRILKRRLETSLDLPPECLSFYDFPEIEDMPGFLRSYREALGRSERWIGDQSQVTEAAREAFAFNIRVSQAVQRLVLAEADPG